MNDRVFRLYPDCKLVLGRKNSAIYDLTRGDIYVVPSELSDLFQGDAAVFDEKDDRHTEFIAFLLENELGQFGMPDGIIAISEEVISPSVISNCIIETGDSPLPFTCIAKDLSKLICQAVCIQFLRPVSAETVSDVCEKFMYGSFRSIEVCCQYIDGIRELLESIIVSVPLCSKIIVFDSPENRKEEMSGDVKVCFQKGKIDCRKTMPGQDYSKLTNANLKQFNEAKQYNHCLYGKVCISSTGEVKNCLSQVETFGNINELYSIGKSLSDIVKGDWFRKLWYRKDEQCRECALRYACQRCPLDEPVCTYSH